MLNRFNFLLSIHAQWQSFMKDPLRIETELGILWQMGREAIAVNPVYHEISGIAGFHRLLYCHRHIDILSFILLYNLWSWNQNKRSLTVSMAGFAMTFGVDFCPKQNTLHWLHITTWSQCISDHNPVRIINLAGKFYGDKDYDRETHCTTAQLHV